MSVDIALPRRLDAATVSDMAAQLIGAALHDDMTLDASQTVHIGALGAQLLLSAQLTTQGNGGTFRLRAPNSRVRDQLSVMGLSQLSMPENDR
ncbi:MAG: STAS domain-containing protein [Pseudomonadota bacterium]